MGLPAVGAILSIHFPLTREDGGQNNNWQVMGTFNPLPSHEGRRTGIKCAIHELSFNPLPSHEGRQRTQHNKRKSFYFQSTSLSRGKTMRRRQTQVDLILSIHFPLTREDTYPVEVNGIVYLSIHFPLTREDNVANRFIG